MTHLSTEGGKSYRATGIKSPRQRNRRTKNDIAKIKEAMSDLLEVDNPQTVRQVFYALTVRGLVGKSEQEYDGTVCRLLGEMREAEDIPFEVIIDNSRWRRRPTTFTGLSDAIWNLAQTYRRDLWADAEDYVEIWCEKDALEIHIKRLAVLNEQIERWDLPIRPNKPGDSRIKKFHRQEGSVELDAIPARELRKLVRDCILEHVDEDLHARLKTLQDGEQKYLKQWRSLFRQGHGWGLL
jgi:hypothetical protein